jgi:hypothetical protein
MLFFAIVFLVGFFVLLVVLVVQTKANEELLTLVVKDMQYSGGQQVFAIEPMRPAVLLATQDSGPKTIGKSAILKCKLKLRVNKIGEDTVTESTMVCGEGVVLTVKGMMFP